MVSSFLSQAFERTFFDPGHPLRWLERCFNRFSHEQSVLLNGRTIKVMWTERAERQMLQSPVALRAEMQLLFSCVVKMRVLFNADRGADMVQVSPNLHIGLHAVASKACDPETFASDYPEGEDLSASYAGRLVPTRLEIDFRQAKWEGQFHLG